MTIMRFLMRFNHSVSSGRARTPEGAGLRTPGSRLKVAPKAR